MPTQRASFGWVPWAIAAALAVFCGLLALDRVRLERQLADIRRDLDADDVFHSRTVCACPADAKATLVATWPSRGVIRISIPRPSRAGYEWAVDAEHKDPISAGIAG
jgi:hypothetical protein